MYCQSDIQGRLTIIEMTKHHFGGNCEYMGNHHHSDNNFWNKQVINLYNIEDSPYHLFTPVY
jgi:hypothetical protein